MGGCCSQRDDVVRSPSKQPVDEKKAEHKALRLVIAGPPACGKGTQCELIVQRYGVVHISTGDILRAEVKAGSELGLRAKEFMDAGKLVPDDLIISMVVARLRQQDVRERGFLLDGFPRTGEQAKALMEAGLGADAFVLLEVPDEVLVERVEGRRSDPQSGKIYHLKFNPPENAEVAARLVQRSDDTREKILVRIQQFKENVASVRGYYKDVLHTVNGNQKKEAVFEAVVRALQGR